MSSHQFLLMYCVFPKTIVYDYDNYRTSDNTGPQCLYSHWSAGLASCSCTKALSHPGATVCQYQEGQCEQAAIPIVVCVCLSWASLSAESHTEMVGQSYQWDLSLYLSFLRLPPCIYLNTEYQSAKPALRHRDLFIYQCNLNDVSTINHTLSSLFRLPSF